jgi:environmental stress-induced protein Ves
MTLLKDWHQIRLQDVPASPWKNGGGTTQSLICWPSPSQWVFRMSVARIDSDGPFSEFMGVERWFAVLRGNGVTLQFPDRRVVLGHKDPALQFSGETACQCSLTRGPTLDFNLMVQGISAKMARIDRLAYVGNFKSQTTLAIFVVEAGGHIQINQQTQELNAEYLYWITLDQDEQIEFNGMHVMLIEMECST